ncbi:hypothetical protein D3C78_856040 [compost metagenome]
MTGLSLRDALEITSIIGIRLVPEGLGYVVSQQEETQNNVKVLKVVLAPPEGSTMETGTAGAADEDTSAADETGSEPSNTESDNTDEEDEASGDQSADSQSKDSSASSTNTSASSE